MSDIKLKEGSSEVGYHFINTYQNCPRKFFLKYVLGIEPVSTSKALLFGTAWHKAIEIYYESKGDGELALAAGMKSLEDNESKYFYSDDYNEDRVKMSAMFEFWLKFIGPQILANYDIISTEETLEIILPNGLKFSGRLDELLRRKCDSLVFVGEHKSTSYSLGAMEKSVDDQDQVTGYEVLVRENKPELAKNFAGTLLDVTYKKGRVVDGRVTEIHRSEMERNRFILELVGITSEIAQKARALETGTPEAIVFPRNGNCCSQYSCPYESICRQRVTSMYPLPETLEYSRDNKLAMGQLGKLNDTSR